MCECEGRGRPAALVGCVWAGQLWLCVKAVVVLCVVCVLSVCVCVCVFILVVGKLGQHETCGTAVWAAMLPPVGEWFYYQPDVCVGVGGI